MNSERPNSKVKGVPEYTHNEPRAMKEIHDIRQQIFEETKELTPEEKAKQTNRIGRDLAEKYGFKVQQKV